MEMTRRCDACGRTNGIAMIGVGAALICRQCEPDVRAEMDRLRAEGKPVNVGHIARRIYRATNCGGDYILRDIPADLWQRVQTHARERGTTARDVILASLEAAVKEGGK